MPAKVVNVKDSFRIGEIETAEVGVEARLWGSEVGYYEAERRLLALLCSSEEGEERQVG